MVENERASASRHSALRSGRAWLQPHTRLHASAALLTRGRVTSHSLPASTKQEEGPGRQEGLSQHTALAC